MRVIKCKYLGKWSAITVAPIGIFINPERVNDKVVLNHERIHWEQQKKYGYIGFYLKYLYEAATKGYRNISFDEEAYEHESDFEYKAK